MTTILKRATVFCFFVAAAMIVAAPAMSQTSGKTETKDVKVAKETKADKDVKVAKATTKGAGCCTDKKSAEAKACDDGSECCVDGKSGKHSKAEHETMKKDADKKVEGKKDDGR